MPAQRQSRLVRAVVAIGATDKNQQIGIAGNLRVKQDQVVAISVFDVGSVLAGDTRYITRLLWEYVPPLFPAMPAVA